METIATTLNIKFHTFTISCNYGIGKQHAKIMRKVHEGSTILINDSIKIEY